MSYSNMWDEEPPSQEETEHQRLLGVGATVISKPQDFPKTEHYDIVRVYSLDCRHSLKHLVFTNKELWVEELKRLAQTVPGTFAAFTAKPATTSVQVIVDVDANE